MRKVIFIGLLVVALALAGCNSGFFGDQGTGTVTLDDDDFVFLNDSTFVGSNDSTFVDSNDSDSNDMVDSEDLGSSDVVLTGDDSDDVTIISDDVNLDDLKAAFTVNVVEGDLVELDLEANDPDGDVVTYTYTSPLNERGNWQTQIGDEGRYLVTVTASDGRLESSEDVIVVVARANRAPIIECPSDLVVDEGDLFYLDCNFYDEEGDDILISYEGWSTSSSKQTNFDDAGEYTVLVRASDFAGESTELVTVKVANVNRPPVLKPIDDITVMETNTVVLNPSVSDPDGDDVTLSFTQPIGEDGVWVTSDGDSGTYEVTVAASDGQSTVTQSFSLVVTQINTAPVLKPIANLVVSEGELIKIPVSAYDPEGDDLVISFAGFMNDQEYLTTFDDAGIYDQTVTVSDGVLSSSVSFTIEVEDRNRPPVFLKSGN